MNSIYITKLLITFLAMPPLRYSKDLISEILLIWSDISQLNSSVRDDSIDSDVMSLLTLMFLVDSQGLLSAHVQSQSLTPDKNILTYWCKVKFYFPQ